MKKGLTATAMLFGALLVGICSSSNVYAESFDGEYSIDYLLRNYNVVTLGIKDIPNAPYKSGYSGSGFSGSGVTQYTTFNKGEINSLTDIEGAVLVNGNYTSVNDSSFGRSAGDVKSYIKGTKGNNVTALSSLVTDANYIDFEKLYKNVLNESRQLIDMPQSHINSANLEISEPGIYTIDNTAIGKTATNSSTTVNNALLINNYDPNDVYIFNYYNEYAYFNIPKVSVMRPGDSNAVPIEYYELAIGEEYTGNVIFNFPYAKFIYLNASIQYNTTGNYDNTLISGSIVAPNAVIYIDGSKYTYSNNSTTGVRTYRYDTYYVGNIIANSVVTNNKRSNSSGSNYSYQYGNHISEADYTSNEKIINLDNDYYYEEANDYNDDIYSRDYSIKDLLENYNLVTLGHKQIDAKAKLSGETPGTIKIFHITGQALIAGNVYSKIHEGQADSYASYYTKYDRTAFDLESNKVTESYIQGNIRITTPSINGSYSTPAAVTVIQPYDSVSSDNYQYWGKKNSLLTNGANNNYGMQGTGNITGYVHNGTYINFNRLYDNIVAEQKGIDKGTELSADSDGVLHITTGGHYNIKNISNINEIILIILKIIETS